MTFTLIGHRGAMGLEPENTLRSFRRAEAEGADLIELDLWLSKDGHLVILHDENVDRTTNGSGPVSGMTLAEIRRLDAGMGETVPTFDEVLSAVDLPIQAEIKTVDAADAVLRTIRDRDLTDRVTVTSFKAEIVERAGETFPGLRTGLIFSGVPDGCIAAAKSVRADQLCVGISGLDARTVEEAHRAGLEVLAWPVNDVERLERALECGADGVTTDFPDRLRAALDDQRRDSTSR